jgi:hypothetical protein
MAARLLSVNIGLPRDINWRGKTVHTGIWVVCAQRPQCVLERKVFEPSRFRGSL